MKFVGNNIKNSRLESGARNETILKLIRGLSGK